MEPALKIAFIAVGGAAGAVGRYLINVSPMAGLFDRFPLPTFLINVSGSFLIGFLMILLTDRVAVSENVRVGLIVGLLGAFTTFSTFEMEIYGLVEDRHFATALLYLMASVLVGFAGVLAGIRLARAI